MDDITLWPTHRQAAAIAKGELASRELLDAQLARIEAANPALNAVVSLDAERARAAAGAADEAVARGESIGPLHGVPVTLKDAYEVAGWTSTGRFDPAERPRARPGRAGRRRAAPGRHRAARPHQRSRVVGRPPDLQRRLRRDQQPLGHQPHAGRIVGWRGRGGGHRHVELRAGHRHRRVDPRPGRLQRSVRSQADLGRGLDGGLPRPRRRVAAAPIGQRLRATGPQRRRPGDRPRRGRGPAPAPHPGVAVGAAAGARHHGRRHPLRGLVRRAVMPDRPRGPHPAGGRRRGAGCRGRARWRTTGPTWTGPRRPGRRCRRSWARSRSRPRRATRAGSPMAPPRLAADPGGPAPPRGRLGAALRATSTSCWRRSA